MMGAGGGGRYIEKRKIDGEGEVERGEKVTEGEKCHVRRK